MSCTQSGTTVTRIDEKQAEPKKVHPLTEDKDYIADQALAKQIKENQSKAKASEKPVPIDPAILGQYKLELEEAQAKQINDMIAKMEDDAANGDKQAVAALPLARQAREAAMNMVINLKSDGRYTANLGSGQTEGTFKMSQKGILLKPAVQSNDPADPVDVEFIWDKPKKSLTVDFQGRLMKFAKKE